jgi:hypothetical protein
LEFFQSESAVGEFFDHDRVPCTGLCGTAVG